LGFAAAVALLFAILVSFRYVREQLVVDDCLSGKHGSFDYSNMVCDLGANHPYISYATRHPNDKAIVMTTLFVLALSVSGYGLFTHLNWR
jgi:hypothetical protein